MVWIILGVLLGVVFLVLVGVVFYIRMFVDYNMAEGAEAGHMLDRPPY